MPETKHLLFVCVENSCRSQMAEGWARTLGESRGIKAWSAGSRPSGKVNPNAVYAMSDAGVDISGHRSQGVDDMPKDIKFAAVVTMGCGDQCPYVPADRLMDWPLPDPKGKSPEFFDQVRDEIRRRVQQLIDEVTAEG